MAIQSSIYTTDGTTRTYPSTKHIATKQHCAVLAKKVSNSLWEVISVNSYTLVNNSIIFIDAPLTSIYSIIEIRVADTQGELTTSPSDIAIVSASIANVNIIANDIINVNKVALNIASVATTSGSITNINSVAGSIANMNSVGVSITNVNTVATNLANINTNVANIVAIQNASANATTATTQATTATIQAGIATTQAVIATAQAVIATTSAASINPLTIVKKDSDAGAAYLPSGTTAQRPASPINGYMRYNSDLLAMEAYVNGSWGSVGGGATGGGTDHVFNNNGYTVTSNYTIPTGMSTVTVGDNNGNVTINSGVTVTVSSGSRWVVL